MTTARIKLIPHWLIRDAHFTKNPAAFVEENRFNYMVAVTIKTDKIGEDAAEEMFDLTNNPSREDERLRLYGRQRSVSVGDVIEVDGVDYFCAGFGWEAV